MIQIEINRWTIMKLEEAVNYHLTSQMACDDDSKATVDYAKRIHKI